MIDNEKLFIANVKGKGFISMYEKLKASTKE